jgi:hypothetical protein
MTFFFAFPITKVTLKYRAISQALFFFLFWLWMQGEVFYLSSKQLGFSVSLRNLPCFAGFIGALGWFLRNGFEVCQPSRHQRVRLNHLLFFRCELLTRGYNALPLSSADVMQVVSYAVRW